MSSALTLRDGPQGLRHYLDDRLVSGGDTLELCFSGGWVVGRYECGADRHRPSFHCSIELSGGGVVDHAFEIPDDALFRWPRS
jgi:hypothetical protein